MANSRQEKIARYKEQKEQERRLKVVERSSLNVHTVKCDTENWQLWVMLEANPVLVIRSSHWVCLLL